MKTAVRGSEGCMSVKQIEKEFSELVSRISVMEIQRNNKVSRCIQEIQRLIGDLKRDVQIEMDQKKLRELQKQPFSNR